MTKLADIIIITLVLLSICTALIFFIKEYNKSKYIYDSSEIQHLIDDVNNSTKRHLIEFMCNEEDGTYHSISRIYEQHEIIKYPFNNLDYECNNTNIIITRMDGLITQVVE